MASLLDGISELLEALPSLGALSFLEDLGDLSPLELFEDLPSLDFFDALSLFPLLEGTIDMDSRYNGGIPNSYDIDISGNDMDK